MSLVIAIKERGRVVLGADKQCSIGNAKDHAATKVWGVIGQEGCVMGGVGFARANQIMQYFTGLIDKNSICDSDSFNEGYVVRELVPTIAAVLAESGITTKASDPDTGIDMVALPNCFIIAHRDKAFVINQDLSVSEVEDYVAIGSGAEVAKGVLYATKDKNPFERISLAIEAAANSTLFVDESVEFVFSEWLVDDERNMNEAFGTTDLEIDYPQSGINLWNSFEGEVMREEEPFEEDVEEEKPAKKGRKKKAKKETK